jgi:cell division septal protein FtsQ
VSEPSEGDEADTNPPTEVLDELRTAFGDGPRSTLEPPSSAAASVDVASLIPEGTRRSRRRSRREARREAKREAKRVAALEKEEKKAAKRARKAAKKSRPQQDVEVVEQGGDDGEDLGVRVIEAPSPPAPATRPTVTIDDDADLPDAVYLEGELGSGGSATVLNDAGGAPRSTVFIDDRGPGTGEIVAVDVARSVSRMEPRMRERRIAVKRAAGRKRLKWFAIAACAIGIVVGALAVLGSGLFAIDAVEVEGAVYSRGDALDAVVAELEGTNVLRVDTRSAERALEAIPWVADARVTTAFPNGARIEIRERRPMVAFRAGDGRFRVLDGNGRVLDVIAGQPVAYLELEVDDGPALQVGQLAPAGYRAAATLVSALTPHMRQRATSVTVDQNATELSLILDDEIEVRFGAAEDLLDKLVRLQTALTNPTPELSATVLIDVSTEDLIIR